MPIGEDFMFWKNAKENYDIIDKIVEAFNKKNTKYQIVYSTPTKYFEALKKEELIYPTKYDDFFPFGDHTYRGNYWVGFYASRPNLKSLIRSVSQADSGLMKLFSLAILKINLSPQQS